MERKLYYATTNKHKVKKQMNFWKKYGFNIEIIDPDFEILEIQADDCSSSI